MIYKLAKKLAELSGYASDVYDTGWYDGYSDCGADIDAELDGAIFAIPQECKLPTHGCSRSDYPRFAGSRYCGRSFEGEDVHSICLGNGTFVEFPRSKLREEYLKELKL